MKDFYDLTPDCYIKHKTCGVTLDDKGLMKMHYNLILTDGQEISDIPMDTWGRYTIGDIYKRKKRKLG